jgi:quinol monooxygenase YgiN
MICLAVHIKVKPGLEGEVAAAFRRLAEESNHEPGCRFYAVQQHQDDATRFLVYEQYDDETALEAHRASPHFQRYAADDIYTKVESRQANLYRPV